MTSIGTLLAFVMVCAGVIILRRTRPELPRPFRVPWVPAIPLLGIGFCLILMFSLDLLNWIRLILWLIIGCCIYFGYGQYHSRETSEG